MPSYTQTQKDSLLQSNGYDPSSYEMDDDLNVYEKVKASPAISTSPLSPQSPDIQQPTTQTANSPLSTFGKSFAQNALPSVGSGLGAAGGAALASWALGPEVGIPVSLLAMLGGGMAGGAGTRALQSAVEPEAWQQNVAQAQQENPTSALLGGIATMPLAGLNPSPSNVLKAGGAAGKLLTGLSTTPEEATALGNVGLGAGIGAIQPAAESLIHGQMPDVKDVLTNAGLGALFNKPNALGRAMGFHSPDIQQQLPGEAETQQAGQAAPETPNNGLNAFGSNMENNALEMAQKRKEWLEQVGSSDRNTPAPDYTKANDFESAKAEKAQQDLLEQQKAKTELDRQEAAQLASENAERALMLENKLQDNQIAATQEARPEPLATTELGREIPKDYTGVTEQNNVEAEGESAADLAERKLEGNAGDKYSEESALADKQKVPSTDRTVADAINEARKTSDDATITAERGDEIHSALKDKVDWSKAPEIHNQLSDKNFDSLDPDHWNTVYNLYLTHLEQEAALAAKSKPTITAPKPVEVPSAKPIAEVKQPKLKYTPAEKVEPETQINIGAPKAVEQRIPIAAPRQAEAETLLKEDPNSYKATVTKHTKLDTTLQLAREAGNTPLGNKLKARATRLLTDINLDEVKNKEPLTKAPRYSEESPLKEESTTKLQDEVVAGLKAKGISSKPTAVWTKMLQEFLKRRNIELREDGSIVNAKTGEPIAGMATFSKALKKWIATINPEKEGLDTAAHEAAGHAFLNQLRESPHQADRDFVAKFEAKVAEHPEFQKMNEARIANGKEAWTPEEFIATQQGLEFVRRQLNLSGETGLKTYWKDLWSHIKTKYDSNSATPEDYTRLLQYRFQNDPAFHDYFKTGIRIEHPINVANQDQSELFKKNDVEDRSTFAKMRESLDEGVKQEAVDHPTIAKDHPELLKTIAKDELRKDPAAYSEKSALSGTDKDTESYRKFKLTKPQLDKAEELTTTAGKEKEGKAFSKAIQTLIPLKDQMQGKYMSPLVKASKDLSEGDLNRVDNVLTQEMRTKTDKSDLLTVPQLKLYKAIRDSYLTKQQDQIKANQPVTDWDASGKELKRLPQVDPFYHNMRIDPKVAEKLMEGTASEQKALRDSFLKYQKDQGISDASAKSKLDAILKAYDVGTPNLNRFAANREAEGIGLPDEWRLKNKLMQNQNAYYSRVAADRAWHDTVEKNPDVATSLGIKNDPWGKPYQSDAQDISGISSIRDIMDNVRGESFHKDEAMLKAMNRLASSFMLGPLTNAHIAAGSLASSMQYLHPTEMPSALTYAVRNIGKNWEKVLDTGYHKQDFTNYKDIVSTTSTGLEKLRSLSTLVSNLSGREGMNHFTKSMLQGIGDYVIRARAIEANGGDREAISLMKRVDPDWKAGKTYSGEDLDKVASNFASFIHGAHDARTLPGWMLKDTAIQPFFSLASWNIAQTNAWMRAVWTPATKGNLTPLLMSTLGAAGGGYVVKKLRETLADKKSAIPSLTELVNSSRGVEGNIPLVAYNLMAMASYTGFAGVMSVLAKAGADIAYKNTPQGAAFPLDELISNPVTRAAQLLTAISNDPDADYLKLGMKFGHDLVNDNFQLGRILQSNLADRGLLDENANYQKQLNTKTQDERRWKMAEGMPYEAQGMTGTNPYLDFDEKSFKRTSDLGEAARQLPDLISDAVKKSTVGGVINPNTLTKEIAKLKGNSYQTFPSPEEEPYNFSKYYKFLQDTQGKEEAQKRLTDFLVKREINKAKSQMIPSL